ncbi:RNA polymerase sigma factor [Demequina salsinemoris]|uniref:RNA polymerase sigma factor n=1 Tax=Demequina salsinemoris TaxID=577470 RepID=UPI0007828348|nr:RNA polymerase sigma factor [Demequina salsinemoris]
MKDRDVVEALYAQSMRRLSAYAYALVGSYSGAEELVQDAIVKTFSKRRRWQDLAAAEAYVRATIRNLHIDAVRRNARWTARLPKLARDEVVPSPEVAVESDEAVAVALASLPPRVRTAIVLRYLDDMTVAAVASAMTASEGTVKRYLSDGRALLSQHFEPGDDDELRETVRVKEARR